MSGLQTLQKKESQAKEEIEGLQKERNTSNFNKKKV